MLLRAVTELSLWLIDATGNSPRHGFANVLGMHDVKIKIHASALEFRER